MAIIGRNLKVVSTSNEEDEKIEVNEEINNEVNEKAVTEEEQSKEEIKEPEVKTEEEKPKEEEEVQQQEQQAPVQNITNNYNGDPNQNQNGFDPNEKRQGAYQNAGKDKGFIKDMATWLLLLRSGASKTYKGMKESDNILVSALFFVIYSIGIFLSYYMILAIFQIVVPMLLGGVKYYLTHTEVQSEYLIGTVDRIDNFFQTFNPMASLEAVLMIVPAFIIRLFKESGELLIKQFNLQLKMTGFVMFVFAFCIFIYFSKVLDDGKRNTAESLKMAQSVVWNFFVIVVGVSLLMYFTGLTAESLLSFLTN